MASGSSVFGFPEFLTAVALLVLVFSTGDSRYRFRMEVAPLHLPRITFLRSWPSGSVRCWSMSGTPKAGRR